MYKWHSDMFGVWDSQTLEYNPLYFWNPAFPEYSPDNWEQALPQDFLIYVAM